MKKTIIIILYLTAVGSIWSQDYIGTWKSKNYEYTYRDQNEILYCELVYTSNSFEQTNYYAEKEGIQFRIWGVIEVVDNQTIKLTTTEYMDQRTGITIPVKNGQVRVLKYSIKDNVLSYKQWDNKTKKYREYFLDYVRVVQ